MFFLGGQLHNGPPKRYICSAQLLMRSVMALGAIERKVTQVGTGTASVRRSTTSRTCGSGVAQASRSSGLIQSDRGMTSHGDGRGERKGVGVGCVELALMPRLARANLMLGCPT